VSQLMKDLKEATLTKDKTRLAVIRRLRGEIMNKEKLDASNKLGYNDCVKVVHQMAKQCEENAKEFESCGHADTATKEREEAKVLRSYLPPQLDEAQLRGLVEETIRGVGATSIKDMKAVMAKLGPLVQGKAEPSAVGELVRNLLTGAKTAK